MQHELHGETTTSALCNLLDGENLRAVLRNESPSSDVALDFMSDLVEDSKTDNGQAASILLQYGRCEIGVDQLEMSLQRGFTAMAAVLQQDERVKKGIKMCYTCSNNIGCYVCVSWDDCIINVGESDDNTEPRYCRDSVLKDDHFCQICSEYLCPACLQRGLYGSCEKCGEIDCLDGHCLGELLIHCQHCNRKAQNGETWWPSTFHEHACPTCL